MPTTRRALLISNPGEKGAENYCKGVYVDVKNFTQFLSSSEGGAWDISTEIKHLDRPSVSIVRLWLALYSTADYSLVIFSGHGWYSSEHKDRILELRKDEQIVSNELIKGARKRTLILDCCQLVHAESTKIKTAQFEALANRYLMRTASRENCRKLFDDGIQRAPLGIVRMTSCSIGETATDDDERGGRYSGSLIECLNDWSQAQARKRSLDGDALMSVVETHECAAAKTRSLSEGQQNPTIEKPRSGPYFPMAVFG